jgi:hypothetical protein
VESHRLGTVLNRQEWELESFVCKPPRGTVLGGGDYSSAASLGVHVVVLLRANRSPAPFTSGALTEGSPLRVGTLQEPYSYTALVPVQALYSLVSLYKAALY